MEILTRQAHFQLCISLKTARAVHNIHQVDGGPGKGHAVAAKTLAELLCLTAKLLQLLFILKQEIYLKKTHNTHTQININLTNSFNLYNSLCILVSLVKM